jgi:phosphoribosylanthranilate isomerase
VTWFKICGLTRREDLDLAMELGASAVGIVGEPSSPRFVPYEAPLIAELQVTDVDVVRVYGVARNEPDGPFTIWQAHQFPEPNETQKRWLALAVGSDFTWPANLPPVDALLLDAKVEGQYGGTGQRIAISQLEDLMAAAPRPVIIAGGLDPDNVAEVIERCRPFGVDVASGVESSPGIKDAGKMRAFAQAVRSVQFPA